MITIGSDTAMPPGGWKFTVPETGQTVTANYASTLWKRVNDHLKANGYPVMERAVFDDAICRESGHGAPWCMGVKEPPKEPTTLYRVGQFLKTMAVLVRRREFVSKEERERRIAICQNCPMSSIEGLGCHGCIQDLREVERAVGALPEGNVITCTACGCLVALKAAISNSVLDEAEKASRPAYAPGCWRDGH